MIGGFIFKKSFEETKAFEKGVWYRPFVVSFIGEPCKPHKPFYQFISVHPLSFLKSGLTSIMQYVLWFAVLEDDAAWLEWAELLLDTVLENNPNGMFHKISEKSGYIHPNPSRNYRRWSVQYYELAGKVIGKYLVERALNIRSLNYRVKVRFSRSFLLQIIGPTPTANVLKQEIKYTIIKGIKYIWKFLKKYTKLLVYYLRVWKGICLNYMRLRYERLQKVILMMGC